MKVDYNKLFKSEIANLTHKPKLVLHVCCAPCSSGVIYRLKQHFEICYFYYNPNIYPEAEYVKRKNEFKKLEVEVVEASEGYRHEEFLKAVKGLEKEPEGGARCRVCIALRMREAFKYAKEIGAEYVTTTLSISPHKDANFINQTGEALEKEFNIKYLHADFKKENGYLNSITACKNLNIYRQNYCGCEFGKGEE